MEIKGYGFIICSNRANSDNVFFIKILSEKFGLISGFAPRCLSMGSFGYFMRRNRRILFESVGVSILAKFWGNMSALDTVKMLCTSAEKIPENSTISDDFSIFAECINELDSGKYDAIKDMWLNHIVANYNRDA